jgi:hypothetical protein
MASIRKHRGKWQAQIRRSGFPHLSRSFINKSDAQVWARKAERQIDNGDLRVDQRSLNGLTVRDLLIRYRDTVTSTKRGARMERYKVGTFLSHPIADCPLRSLTPSTVAQYRDERLKTVKSGTVHRELSVFRHCIEVARKEWGYPLPLNPVANVTLPKLPDSRSRRPTSEEVERLLECLSPLKLSHYVAS